MLHIWLSDSHAVAQTSVVLEQGRCFGHLDVQEDGKVTNIGVGKWWEEERQGN